MVTANIVTSMGQVILKYYWVKKVTKVKKKYFKRITPQMPRKIFLQKKLQMKQLRNKDSKKNSM